MRDPDLSLTDPYPNPYAAPLPAAIPVIDLAPTILWAPKAYKLDHRIVGGSPYK